MNSSFLPALQGIYRNRMPQQSRWTTAALSSGLAFSLIACGAQRDSDPSHAPSTSQSVTSTPSNTPSSSSTPKEVTSFPYRVGIVDCSQVELTIDKDDNLRITKASEKKAISIKRKGETSLQKIFHSSPNVYEITYDHEIFNRVQVLVDKTAADYTKDGTLAIIEKKPHKDFPINVKKLAIECQPPMDGDFPKPEPVKIKEEHER